MAHIFKIKSVVSQLKKVLFSNKKTGIIVLTHKEKRWAENDPDALNIIREINKDYFIGIHYGHRMEGMHKSDFEDFCMGAKSVVEFAGPEPLRIPLNSRAFTPSFFKNMGIPKFYDVINISRNITLKKLDVFLNAVRNIYDEGYDYKFLLIVPTSENETNDGNFFLDIVEKYNTMFSRKERENFTLIRLSGEHGFLGISPLTIAYLYNSSKIFSLPSPGEGESRVIHEALLCGLPIVCYNKLYGGGRDYLDESNSLQFDSYEKVAETFVEAIKNYPSFRVDSDSLSHELSENYSIENLHPYFEMLFKNENAHYDRKLDNIDYLNLRLPGHYTDVPWKSKTSNTPTADILSIEQLITFKALL